MALVGTFPYIGLLALFFSLLLLLERSYYPTGSHLPPSLAATRRLGERGGGSNPPFSCEARGGRVALRAPADYPLFFFQEIGG